MPEPSRNLGRRFLVSGLQLGSANWLTYAVNFAIQIALARILGPESFGLYAFVLAINEFVNIIGAFSFGLALLQDREESQSRYDTALILYALIALGGLAISAGIAVFLLDLRGPTAAWFLLVMAGSRFFLFATQVPQARLERDLRYGVVSAATAISGVVPNLFALGLAVLGVGPWALVIRDFLTPLLQMVIVWVWSGYRFRGEWSREAVERLMPFARKMFMAQGLMILLNRVDRVAVGVFFGNVATGLYDRARFLAEAGYLISRPISQLSFNLYARTRDDRARLGRGYHLLNYFMARVMLMGSATLLVFPEETVRLILGDDWIEAAPILRWLALYGGLFPVFVNVRLLFFGTGDVNKTVLANLIQLSIFVPGVIAAGFWGGPTGMAASLLVSMLVAFAVSRRWVAAYVDPGGESMRTALGCLAAVAVGFLAADLAGWLDPLPWMLLPFLPPIGYLALLGLIEGRGLLRELRYFRALLGGS